MDFNWLTVNKLINPGTNVGAITLAIVFIVIAWAACVVTTSLVQGASWVMGRLKRQVDDFWLARFWLLEHVKKRFDREGVEIPFPYRTVVYKKDLPPPRSEECDPGQPV